MSSACAAAGGRTAEVPEKAAAGDGLVKKAKGLRSQPEISAMADGPMIDRDKIVRKYAFPKRRLF
jgi:hypothetical protein